MTRFDELSESDPDLAVALGEEVTRQQETLTLIASENHATPAVLAVQGSVLTNKYAEGYPGERYYAGCDLVDEVERLAIKRAKALWGAEHVNVQPTLGRRRTWPSFSPCSIRGTRSSRCNYPMADN